MSVNEMNKPELIGNIIDIFSIITVFGTYSTTTTEPLSY